MVLALREGDELVIRAASGEVDRSQLELAIPLESLSGYVLRSGRAQRLSDSTPGVRAVLPKTFDAHTELVVPLRFRGQGLGVLAALDRLGDGPEFSAEDERLMTAFASSAATAVATARDVAAEGLRRSLEAAERERRSGAGVSGCAVRKGGCVLYGTFYLILAALALVVVRSERRCRQRAGQHRRRAASPSSRSNVGWPSARASPASVPTSLLVLRLTERRVRV